MQEIELKFLNIDIEKTRDDLRKIGAQQVFGSTLFKETYYELPGVENPKCSTIRIRVEGDKIFLNAKSRFKESAFRSVDEYEIPLNDFETGHAFLEVCGFEVVRRREKIREEWVKGDVVVEIDQYPRMAPYMEIEAESEEGLSDFMKLLGLDLTAGTNKTASDVISDAGLDPKNLLFD
jgi:adenylate cyclase, class 2